MRRLLLLATLFLVLACAAFSQTREDHARALLKLTGADTLAVQMIDMMIPEVQKLVPEAPASFWQEFRNKVDVQQLIEMLAAIYVRHYTDEEILQLIDFYQTPIGQKLIQETPSISQESFSAGQAWGQRIAEEILKELSEAGYPVS